MTGRIKLHRSSQDNELYFSEPFTRWQARQDLILFANHADGSIVVRGNIIQLKRGQNGYSEETLAKRWKWSRNKVRRYLKYLETIQQIEQQKSTVKSIITITNYNKFQGNDTTDDTTERHQTIQQTDTNNNDKKNKNDKKIYNTPQSIKYILSDGELVEERGLDILEEFVNYRSEPNKAGKEKWMLERTWDTNLRLKKWKNNRDTNFGTKQIIDYEIVDNYHIAYLGGKLEDVKQYFKNKYPTDRQTKYRQAKEKYRNSDLFIKAVK